MRRIKSSLILRIAAPIIILVLVLGISLYFLVLPTVSGFVKTRVEHDLKDLSRKIYNICNNNFDGILMAGKADDEKALVIQKALTLGQLEDIFRQENLNGFVYSINEWELLVKTTLPADPRQIIDQVQQQGILISLDQKTKGYFAYGFDFSPWGWQIIILKNEIEYTDLITKVRSAHLYTLGLLVLAAILLVFFIYQTIKRPVYAIIRPLQKGKKPRYSGIDVFEYLSISISRMMASIRKSEEKYRSLVETTSDFVWEVDKKGRFTHASKTIKTILGYEPEEVLGKSPMAFMPDKVAKEALKNLKPYTLEKQPFERLENVHLHKNGYHVVLETSGVPVWDETGDFTGYRGIDRDITERLNTEKQQKKLEAKVQQLQRLETIGTLAGGIAHDFNNLLAVIMGNISLAEFKITHDTGIRKYLGEAEKASSRAQKLIRQLITFAKGGTPVKEVVPISSLLVNTVKQSVSGSDISCNFNVPKNLWLVDIDEHQIRQALENIAINAVEAMPDGGSIEVKAQNHEIRQNAPDAYPPLARGKYVRIRVKDSGVGMTQKHMASVFDPYFSTKEMGKQKGMGLGLAITHSIINRHDGQISVESQEGKGSTFDLYLPAFKKYRDASPLKKQVKIGTAKLHNKRILVMDDEKMIRTIAQQILEQMGCRTDLAKDGDQAIELYRQSLLDGDPFDIVILDLTVKNGMGGKDAVRKLMVIDKNVKAIVSSGYSNSRAMTDFTAYGFIGTLSKPYSMQDLKDAVNEAFLYEKP